MSGPDSGSTADGAVRTGFRLGRIFGIDVVADGSLFVLGLLLVGSLFADLRRVAPGTSPEWLLAAATLGGTVFIGSILVHELSHSVLALRRELPVRRIRLFIFGGVSEIEREASNPGDEFVIAVAGPITSAVVGGALWLGAMLMPPDWLVAARLARVLGVVNLLLAGFNLLPGFPLDGGRALRAILWSRDDRDRATRRAIEGGRVLALVLIGAGAWLLLRRRDITGLWTVAVGWYLLRAAVNAAEREDILARIAGLTVGDIMRPVTETVPGGATVAAVVALHQVGPVLQPVPVVVDGRVRGVIGDREIASFDDAARAAMAVAEVMTPVGPRDVVDAGEALDAFVSRPDGPSPHTLVVSGGRVVGIVSGRELGRAISG